MDLSRTVEPVAAITKSHLKRKHHETIDLAVDESDGPVVSAPTPQTEHLQSRPESSSTESDFQQRPLDEEASTDGEEDASLYEDILDAVELDPFKPSSDEHGSKNVLPETEVIRLHTELRDIGPENFVERYITSSSMPHRLLGTAFGFDPELGIGDTTYLRILAQAITRTYYKRRKLAHVNTIDDAANLLRNSNKILVITGAGISTSLGIPDFRSKGSGFYDKLQSMGYSEPEEVFDIQNFDEDPSIFYRLAGDIMPDLNRYSPTHAFIKLLQDKGRLQTNYTQNIDNLEELAGIDRSRLIQCHGSFATATCRKCGDRVAGSEIFDDIRAKRVARCKQCQNRLAERARLQQPKPKRAKPRRYDWEDSSNEDADDAEPEAGVMKPDITFFGEQLNDDFFNRFTQRDQKETDLVIVIGTSLQVKPVSELPQYVPAEVPLIYVSKQQIEHINFDIQLQGECDHVVYELCRRAGWKLEHEMIPKDLKVQVAPIDGFQHRWAVTPIKQGGLVDGLFHGVGADQAQHKR
ncbi:hypothetical protein BAUCODRAFT_144801 [Baudoinia panamericana UAMH 10762]|uniref:Deacetylase sirtuin-type domain-containing protein n=1 Tax=Baudoinia panamericana (strain UAMH 10762) TaxID=717646 RepID=M2NNY5_BAUPA|nr:uncharacterized protein BAUCODRAFT_144801 [Baudoinia panamericana UAMH 10762]EMD01255.1 hypothetical protein BAUCODRAFT_144801 [Baudoinia panamericana UAMH 10762]